MVYVQELLDEKGEFAGVGEIVDALVLSIKNINHKAYVLKICLHDNQGFYLALGIEL